jgi:hypothetical protein
MSKEVRSLSESEVQLWGTEEDDMTEGDLGYGLGRRPGGIYEVDISHLLTSRKRSDGKNFSPPPLPSKGEERSGAIFQYSKHKSLQDRHPQGSTIANYRRQSSTGKNAEFPLLPFSVKMISAVTVQTHEDNHSRFRSSSSLFSRDNADSTKIPDLIIPSVCKS